jgi:hypothetical protein
MGFVVPNYRAAQAEKAANGGNSEVIRSLTRLQSRVGVQ